MRQPSILDRIWETFSVQHDNVDREPLPQRWIDLIHYLNAQEIKEGETQRQLSRSGSAAAGSGKCS